MKKTLLISTLLVLSLIYSCKNDTPDVAPITQTSFDIGSVHYVSNLTTAYQTDFGQLLKITGDNFEMYIIISDTASKTYSIADTITGSDVGKARCIFKTNNSFAFSTTGTLAYNSSKKSGTFEINTEDLNLKNGQIKVDTTITHSIIDFTKVSENDVNGWPITLEDITDWNIRTNWEVAERFVFNLKPLNTLPSTIKLNEYPNPFINTFSLRLDIPQQSKADFYLMNANFEIEQKFVGLSSGNTMLQLNHNLNKGKYYRLCYKIYSVSEQLYGTGDLKIME
jgi:hypothetical protein